MPGDDPGKGPIREPRRRGGLGLSAIRRRAARAQLPHIKSWRAEFPRRRSSDATASMARGERPYFLEMISAAFLFKEQGATFSGGVLSAADEFESSFQSTAHVFR